MNFQFLFVIMKLLESFIKLLIKMNQHLIQFLHQGILLEFLQVQEEMNGDLKIRTH